MKTFVSRNPVATFITLTLGFQVGLVLLAYRLMDGGSLDAHPMAHNVFRSRPFWPLLIAVGITWWLEGRRGLEHLFGSFLHWRVPAKWYIMALSWKAILGYIGISVAVLLGLRAWPAAVPLDAHLVSSLLKNLPFILGIALVEETSWMKFGVTRMQAKYPAWRSCLTVGAAWGAWYVPMVFLREGVPSGVAWQAALLSMISLTFFLSWVYNETRSGTVLFVMQVISNCTFLLVPILPNGPDLDQTFAVAYALTFCTLALIIVWRAGPQQLCSRGQRAMWGEAADRSDALQTAPGLEPVAAEPVPVKKRRRKRPEPALMED